MTTITLAKGGTAEREIMAADSTDLECWEITRYCFDCGTVSDADAVEAWIEQAEEREQYEARVQALEDEGLTRSDAQAVVDAEELERQAATQETPI